MERKILLDLLQKCGHFLHHQKGKKFGQYRILLMLKKNPSLAQKELLNHLHIQAGSLSEILLKMEMQGLLERTKAENDKRKTVVHLTQKGLAKVEELMKEYEQENENLFSSLNDEECKILFELLKKLYVSWKGEEYAEIH